MTRSSAPLRSPLSFETLGLLGVILFASVTLGCGTQQPAAPASTAGSARQANIPAPGELPPECLTHPKNTDPDVTPPRIVHRVEPDFGPTAPRPVYVCLEAMIQADGSVTDVKVIKSGGVTIDEVALHAARQWRWSPATRKGVPIAYPLNIMMTVR